jgi:hypothetical protein
MAALGLPEGYLPAVGRANDAAPTARTLAGLEQHGGAQPARPLRSPLHPVDLGIGQPQGARGAALYDASAEAAAEVEREIGAGAGIDLLRAPVKQP